MNTTIYVPILGRPLHTLRWMWHSNRTSLPFRVLIAGDSGPVVQRILEQPKLFPNLDYTYLKYDEPCYKDYFFKNADVMSKVETPYVSGVDSDDFAIVAGLKRAAKLLDENPDAASAGGWIGAFALYERNAAQGMVAGEMYRYSLFHKGPPLTGDTVIDRVLKRLANPNDAWNGLHRIESNHRAHSLVVESGIETLDMLEDLYVSELLVSGNNLCEGSNMTVLRQLGTSIAAGSMRSLRDRVIDKGWQKERDTFISSVSRSVAEADGTPVAEVEEQLSKSYDERINKSLQEKEKLVKTKPLYKMLLIKAARLALRLKPARAFRAARERAALIGTLAGNGADPQYLSDLDRELTEIEETLTGPGFLEFVHRVAPELLDADKANA